jgi:NAD(P)-dependent dehydrogenase (short-subunit alcohol dehydrogenase family)
MLAPSSDKPHVLVTGVDAAAARDVVGLLAESGASVTAADHDAETLRRLARDVGPYRAEVGVARVDLGSPRDVGLWQATLASRNRLPHLMICCCGGAPAWRHGASTQRASTGLPNDVALGEASNGCPAALAERVLRPALFVHAEPLRSSGFNPALAVLRHPTLRGLLERWREDGVCNSSSAIAYVRIASHVAARHQTGAAPSRIRLSPPAAPHSRRANAA